MQGSQRRDSFCVVCRKQVPEHSGSFLVLENAWLDRLKILSWHPALAAQSEMHSVCSQRHLELLITHWLTYANLQFDRARIPEFVLASHGYRPGDAFNLPPPGQLVGELSVHRESATRLWTGSAQAREGIFEALSLSCERPCARALGTPAEEFVQEDFCTVPAGDRQRFSEYAVSP